MTEILSRVCEDRRFSKSPAGEGPSSLWRQPSSIRLGVAAVPFVGEAPALSLASGWFGASVVVLADYSPMHC
ncbi:hypothetical protein BV25DRAFT_1833427 [Artomyces pyxidatus]|uniref:Uncharacterized protein n=1 Tax=Artomyces pyxidatus TaxID=48021 RepID=A0ACB8SH51_9AGAM|nr:hypothetical protein BV25DRAFT_1833427 [Artomyces pyxidatus]